jgi:hypothetical protein
MLAKSLKKRRYCMSDVELYPALVDYIYENAYQFRTEDEKLASSTIHIKADEIHPAILEFKKRHGQYSDDAKITTMIADGFDAFKRRVAERIYGEHKNELILNLCPKCGKVARTSLAKQCRFCCHDWH